jgi:hypothetical protein
MKAIDHRYFSRLHHRPSEKFGKTRLQLEGFSDLTIYMIKAVLVAHAAQQTVIKFTFA